MNPGKENITLRTIFVRDTILHLRVPFSFYLLPIFCFGVSQAPSVHVIDTTIVFIALHLFIYPGSNVYNSYMDNDTGSIGGLKNPPPATRKLYYASIIFDTAGLMLCALSGWRNMLVMAGYTAFSKAYSWHGIRMKKYAWSGWASVAFFQGGYTFMLADMAAQNQVNIAWFSVKNLLCMLFASLIIGGSYPLTQIYQHEEDSLRGDYTISYRLGVIGTLIFTILFFSAGTAVAFYYFRRYYSIGQFFIFAGCATPVFLYLSGWFLRVWKDRSFADYDHVMRMNKISSICMIICFVSISVSNTAHVMWLLW